MNHSISQSKLIHSRQTLFIASLIIIYWLYCLYSNNLSISHGILDTGWLSKVLFFVLSCHLTMVTISIYLHRSQTHMAIEYHPLLRHFFRFWLWLTTGIVRSEWVAIHRAHHQAPDQQNDPHSPAFQGIKNMFLSGIEIYNRAKKPAIISKFGYVNDNDVLEKYLYCYAKAGPATFLILEVALFGIWGVAMWSWQMIFSIMMQTSIINGLGHYYGYRNFDTEDNSHNLMRWGILVAGEELHNNHHADPAAAKFSCQKSEWDIGWFYIQILRKLHLAKLRKNQEQ